MFANVEHRTAGADGNLQVTLVSYSDAVPGPEHFELVHTPVPRPRPEQALCRTLFVSLDPYLRVGMLPPTTRVPTSGAPMALGSVVPGRGSARSSRVASRGSPKVRSSAA